MFWDWGRRLPKASRVGGGWRSAGHDEGVIFKKMTIRYTKTQLGFSDSCGWCHCYLFTICQDISRKVVVYVCCVFLLSAGLDLEIWARGMENGSWYSRGKTTLKNIQIKMLMVRIFRMRACTAFVGRCGLPAKRYTGSIAMPSYWILAYTSLQNTHNENTSKKSPSLIRTINPQLKYEAGGFYLGVWGEYEFVGLLIVLNIPRGVRPRRLVVPWGSWRKTFDWAAAVNSSEAGSNREGESQGSGRWATQVRGWPNGPRCFSFLVFLGPMAYRHFLLYDSGRRRHCWARPLGAVHCWHANNCSK